MPRIKPIAERDEVSPPQLEEFDHIIEVLGHVSGPFQILLHSPGLATKVMEAGAQVRLGSTLKPEQRELAIIATAREKDASYEWNSHTSTARRVGVRDEVIERIRSKSDVADLQPDERDIIMFVRQLLQANRVEQSLFDELVARHDQRWLVELCATVGQYQYIAAINNAFEVLPPPGSDTLEN